MGDLDSNPIALPRRFSSSAKACLIAILLVSIGIDLFFFTGFYASDDVEYLSAALRVRSEGRLGPQPGLGSTRLTVVGWNMLVASIFGFRIPLIAGSYVVFHQAINFLVCILGRRMFDVRVGLLAAYGMATVPLAVSYSTTVLPDLPMTCFLMLALVAFQSACDAGSAGRRQRALILVFASGLSIGLAYMAKEAALVVLPVFLGWSLLSRRRFCRRTALLTGASFAAGLAFVLVAEWCVLSYLVERPYSRLGGAVGPESVTAGWRSYPDGYYPLERLGQLIKYMAPWFVNTRLDVVLLIGFLVYPFLKGRRWPVWWFALWYSAYHLWGSSSLTEYVPTSLQPRYFTPALPPLFIILSFVVLRLGRALRAAMNPLWTRRLQPVLLLMIVIYPLFGLHRVDRWAGKLYGADIVSTTRRAIGAARALSVRPILLSGTVSRRLALLLEYEPNPRILAAHTARNSRVRKELSVTGFYFVEVHASRRLDQLLTPDGLDRLFRPLLETFRVADPPTTFGDERPTTPTAGQVLGVVTLAGRTGEVRFLQEFACPHKRSESVWENLVHGRLSRPARYARSALLLEWRPVRESHIQP